jgi:hypothetical protein
MSGKIEVLEAVIEAADEAVLRSRSGSSGESAFNRFAALLEKKLEEWREEEEKLDELTRMAFRASIEKENR